MLQNAVHPIQELRQVKTSAAQLQTQTGKAITYANYIGLLYSAAAQYDSQFSSASGAKLAAKRQVFWHDVDQGDDVDDYDLDTPIAVIQANQMVRREAMMPGSSWSKLTEAERNVWDQLSDETKMVILNARSQGKPKTPTAPPFGRRKDKRMVNLHDVIQACQHLTLDAEIADDAIDTPPVDEDVPDQASDQDHPADLLAYVTDQKPGDSVPPAHLAKMMSEAINRHSKAGQKGANTNNNTRKVSKCVIERNDTNVVYSVSRNACVSSYGGALIDGGSNGGLAGEEMRVIDVYDNGRTVDIEGIDRHRMTGIPLELLSKLNLAQS